MTDHFSESKPKQPSHIAYTVQQGKDDQSHWQKIGAAWATKGDGLNLKLTSIPLDGNVVLRSRAELERMRAEREDGPKQGPQQTL